MAVTVVVAVVVALLLVEARSVDGHQHASFPSVARDPASVVLMGTHRVDPDVHGRYGQQSFVPITPADASVAHSADAPGA